MEPLYEKHFDMIPKKTLLFAPGQPTKAEHLITPSLTLTNVSPSSLTLPVTSDTMELPKLELDKFSGDASDWRGWSGSS